MYAKPLAVIRDSYSHLQGNPEFIFQYFSSTPLTEHTLLEPLPRSLSQTLLAYLTTSHLPSRVLSTDLSGVLPYFIAGAAELIESTSVLLCNVHQKVICTVTQSNNTLHNRATCCAEFQSEFILSKFLNCWNSFCANLWWRCLWGCTPSYILLYYFRICLTTL